MQTLGVEDYIEKPGYVVFPTVCHNEDPDEASMKLYYYENSHMFVCYTEEGSMNIFTYILNLPFVEGAPTYADELSIWIVVWNYNLILWNRIAYIKFFHTLLSNAIV